MAVRLCTTVAGIIGCGARLRHIGNLLRTAAQENVRFAYIFDPSEESCAIGGPDAGATGGRDRLRRDAQRYERFVDHDRLAEQRPLRARRRGARAGKNVFCEKPLATTVDDCLAIRDAVQNSGQQFVVGFTLRYSPFYREVQRLVAAGTSANSSASNSTRHSTSTTADTSLAMAPDDQPLGRAPARKMLPRRGHRELDRRLAQLARGELWRAVVLPPGESTTYRTHRQRRARPRCLPRVSGHAEPQPLHGRKGHRRSSGDDS